MSAFREGFQKALISVTLVASAVGGWYGIQELIRVDALERFKKPAPLEAPPGVVMKEADFAVWDGARLMVHAHVGTLEIAKDRSFADLANVSAGKFYGTDQSIYAFSGETARYDYFNKRLTAEKGAQVRSKELDITTPAFTYDELAQRLTAPGMFKGKVVGGDATARNLIYNTQGGTFTTGPITWAGPIKILGGQPRKWEVKGATAAYLGNDTFKYTQGRATDGELIVKADIVEHNTKTDVLVARGNVRYFGKEANLTAPKATIYHAEGRSVFEGGVNMLLKAEDKKGLKEEPIPPLSPIVPDQVKADRPVAISENQPQPDENARSLDTLRDYPTTIIAERIEYWYREGSRRATVTGSPQARQELTGNRWRMVWAHQANYDGEGDSLVLKSRPGQKDARLKVSTGDDFRATEFTISTKEGDDTWNAKDVEGVTYIDEDELPTPPGGGGGSTGGGGGGTTGSPPSLSGPIGS